MYAFLSDTFINKVYLTVVSGAISQVREGVQSCDLRVEPTKLHVEQATILVNIKTYT